MKGVHISTSTVGQNFATVGVLRTNGVKVVGDEKPFGYKSAAIASVVLKARDTGVITKEQCEKLMVGGLAS